MTQHRARLDESRSFGIVYGGGACRYQQDGKPFDLRGIEIISAETTGEATAEQSHGDTVVSAAHQVSAATVRMRRTRRRKRAGIIVVRDLEITKKHIDVLVARNLLTPAKIGDQQKVALAVRRALDEWGKA